MMFLYGVEKLGIIILSHNNNLKSELNNVTYCNSIEECLNVCKKLEYEKIFISGGARINNAFMERCIVNKIILNYNPYILNKGIPLFEGNYFENKLKLENVVKEKDGIVQVHYSVINE